MHLGWHHHIGITTDRKANADDAEKGAEDAETANGSEGSENSLTANSIQLCCYGTPASFRCQGGNLDARSLPEVLTKTSSGLVP